MPTFAIGAILCLEYTVGLLAFKQAFIANISDHLLSLYRVTSLWTICTRDPSSSVSIVTMARASPFCFQILAVAKRADPTGTQPAPTKWLGER
jgi:hypothetical protein